MCARARVCVCNLLYLNLINWVISFKIQAIKRINVCAESK